MPHTTHVISAITADNLAAKVDEFINSEYEHHPTKWVLSSTSAVPIGDSGNVAHWAFLTRWT